LNEEIQVKFGGDTSGLATAMRGMVSQAKSFGTEIKGAFSTALGAVGISFGLGAIIGGIRSLGAEIKQLKSDAEVGGVSVQFIQQLRNAGIASGVTGEQVAKLLNKLEQTLPVGSDVEEEFLKMADAMAATNDPIEKMNIAVAKFGGKLGPVMVDLAGQGGAAMKELAAGMSSFSDTQIALLERANTAWEIMVSKIKQAGAATLEAADMYVRANKLIGDYRKAGMGKIDLTEAYRLVRLMDESDARHKKEKEAVVKEEVESNANQVNADKQDADAAKNLAKIVKEMAQDKISGARVSLSLAEKELEALKKQKETRNDFGKLSLGDLADRGNQGAQRARNLKSQIENAEANGNSGLAASLRNQYLQTVKGISGLTSSEKAPFVQDPFDKAMQDAMNQANTSTGRTGWADYIDRQKGRSRIGELNNIGRDRFNEDKIQRQTDLAAESKILLENLSSAIKGGVMQTNIVEPETE